MDTPLKNSWLLLSGVLLTVLAHLSYHFALAGWLAYAPFLIYMQQTSGTKSRLWLLLALFVAWSLATAKIITEPLSYLMVVMYSVPLSIIHFSGFIAWSPWRKHKLSFLIFPAIMTLLEWLQYSFTPLGSWGAAAYTQLDNPLILQSLSLFGLPGLSFLIYLVNFALSDWYIFRQFHLPAIRISALWVIGLLLFGGIRIHSYHVQPKTSLLAAAIDTDCRTSGLPLPSAEEKLFVNKALFERSQQAASMGAKLIVWTEAATVVCPKDEPQWHQDLQGFCRINKVNLIAAYILPLDTIHMQYDNKYVLVDSLGQIVYSYSKHEPVPGEPAKRGKEEIEVFKVDDSRLGGAICYDYDFPYLAKAFGNLGADIVAVPSSDWRGIDPLHTQMAAYRAIEQGHSVLRSTRFGLSAGINPIGEFVGFSSSFDQTDKILLVSLPSKRIPTLYQYIGDLLIYLSIVFLIVLAFISLLRFRRHKGQSDLSHEDVPGRNEARANPQTE
ncbi:MAG: hypothetical protein K9I34_06490 [Bacteroidales bacterium]|nr:hypothetical protein [Bacteroidales bacterium]